MSKVALITGGTSGIGLALTKHLLAKNWDVVIADIQTPPQDADLDAQHTLFIKTDVSSFENQAQTFQQAFQWRGHLDFAVLNAGIDDYDNIFASIDPSKPPRKPDMTTFEVDLYGVYYGIKLFAHYAAQNPTPGGRIVVTSSVAGFYANPALPQYVAAKHGVIGLVRSLALVAAPHNVAINAIAPAIVATNIDANLVETFSEANLTPMSVVLRAFDELMDEELKHNGATVEVCVEGLFYREPIELLSDNLKRLGTSEGTRSWVASNIERTSRRTRLREAEL